MQSEVKNRAIFLQMWIEHGARKFYFYIHSISKEVDDMLKIYENDPLINVERIQWGPFKVNKTANVNDNPNFKIFQAEVSFHEN